MKLLDVPPGLLSNFHEQQRGADFHFLERTNEVHAGFLSPSFRMRETKVLGLMLSNSAAPPGP